MYRLDIYEITSGDRVLIKRMSEDSSFSYRHQTAERLIKGLGYAEDFYVVEVEESPDGSEQVLNKFRV